MELMAVARAIHIAATVLLAGGAAFRFLVMPSHLQQERPAQLVDAWLRTIYASVLPVALLSWFAWLAFVGANMSGKSIAEAANTDVMQALLMRTTFGKVWIVRLGLLLLLSAMQFQLMTSRAAQALFGGLASAALLSLAWTGHALGGSPWHLAADAIHFAGVGLWLGTLLPLILVFGHARSSGDPAWHALAGAVTRRFSSLGVLAVAALASTGVVNSFRLLGSLDGLSGTAYGRLLLGKLILFAAMLIFAAINRFILTPRLDGRTFDSTVRLLWRNALIEVLLGAAILGIVAILGVTPPTVHEREHDPGSAQHGSPNAHGVHETQR